MLTSPRYGGIGVARLLEATRIVMCKHESFACSVEVARITNPAGDRVERYQANVRVVCDQCQTVFRFLGLPPGLDLNGAAVSVDGAEGRFAIAPKGEVVSELEGAGGFTVKRTDPEADRKLIAENERLKRDMQSLVSGFRSHLGDLITRIGPARRPEDIKAKLQEIHDAYNAWGDRSIERALMVSLEELVKLQSHYADLLNQFDAGRRHRFASAEEWVARLREIGKLPY